MVHPRLNQRLLGLVCALLALAAWSDPGGAQNAPGAARQLVIERIEVEGNTRTPDAILLEYVDLAPGDRAAPGDILAAARKLGGSTIVRSAKVHTRRGSLPGRVVVVFVVEESRPHVRFGAGYENLSGWYLIPAELNLDNVTGHGEALDVGFRIGYRITSLDFSYRSRIRSEDRTTWGAGFHVEGVDRVYFFQGTEVNQRVSRARIQGGPRFSLSSGLHLDSWVAFEAVDADSNATVYQSRDVLGRTRGDGVPFESLPPEIQAAVGRRNQFRVGGALTLDGRQGRNLEQRGRWGEAWTEAVLSEDGSFLSLGAELRSFHPVGSALLAGRVRAEGVTENAPFYERPYLGGLYWVRGFPSQSLSPPEGDLATVIGSVEFRTPWIGSSDNPRLTGILFLDLGVGWGDKAVESGGLDAGIGYGWRIGIPWIQQLGIDVGIPLSESPVNEAFHVNLSLWWTF